MTNTQNGDEEDDVEVKSKESRSENKSQKSFREESRIVSSIEATWHVAGQLMLLFPRKAVDGRDAGLHDGKSL